MDALNQRDRIHRVVVAEEEGPDHQLPVDAVDKRVAELARVPEVQAVWDDQSSQTKTSEDYTH